MIDPIEIASARIEYLALPDEVWRKDFFDEDTGGYVATHVLKTIDDMRIPGIAAEVNACYELAAMGKNVLRLPENIPDLLDVVLIEGKPYRELLKFKPGETIPRGYPDAYFDGKTWDFKTSTFKNDDSLRQTIKEGRKADNLIFLPSQKKNIIIEVVKAAIGREVGSRAKDGTWTDLPNIYYITKNQLINLWKK